MYQGQHQKCCRFSIHVHSPLCIDHINMKGQSPPRLSYIISTVIWQAEEAYSLIDFEEVTCQNVRKSGGKDYDREQCLRNNLIVRAGLDT